MFLLAYAAPPVDLEVSALRFVAPALVLAYATQNSLPLIRAFQAEFLAARS